VVDRFRLGNEAERGTRTVAMWSGAVSILGDICIDITAEPLTITKCGGGKIEAGSVNSFMGARHNRAKQTTVKA